MKRGKIAQRFTLAEWRFHDAVKQNGALSNGGTAHE
jgi:hypothetical protein